MESQLGEAFKLLKMASGGEKLRIEIRALLLIISRHLEMEVLSAVNHPVGFVMVDLSEISGSDLGMQFRLHVWPKAYRRDDGLGAIHDHSWKLTSAVIVGGLTDVNFEAQESPGGRGFVRVKYTASGNEFRGLGNYDLLVSRQRKMNAPYVYTLMPGVLHMTTVDVFPTATLVVADRRASGQVDPMVVMENRKVPLSTGSRSILPPVEAASLVSGLVDHGSVV